jgi:hypothetical protein
LIYVLQFNCIWNVSKNPRIKVIILSTVILVNKRYFLNLSNVLRVKDYCCVSLEPASILAWVCEFRCWGCSKWIIYQACRSFKMRSISFFFSCQRVQNFLVWTGRPSCHTILSVYRSRWLKIVSAPRQFAIYIVKCLTTRTLLNRNIYHDKFTAKTDCIVTKQIVSLKGNLIS